MATRKCKGEDHVNAEPTQSVGDAPGLWDCVVIEDYYCRNAADQSGRVYMLTRNGKPKIHMLTELAEVMPSRLRLACAGGRGVRGTHKRFKLDVTFATWSHGAALELADKIEAVTV